MTDYRTPGQLIEALLAEKGWDQRVLAVVLDLDTAILSKIISGKRRVDASLALDLGEVFKLEPERFLALQQSYDLAQAKIVARPDEGRANRAVLFGELPIAEMISRGWIKARGLRDVPAVESELARFFGVSSPEEIELLPFAAKKTDTAKPVTATQLAWICRVKQLSCEMLVPKYSPQTVRRAIDKLRNLLSSAEEIRKVPRILAEAGIRFVIVEALKSSKIDGVCLWLDDNSPVIGISLRFDRIDNFWFVLRHELEHVLQLHGRSAIMLDTDLDGRHCDVAEEERLANDAASDFCVSQKQLDALVTRKTPLFAERDVLAFSKMLEVHPGVVVGQLQRRTQRYELLRKHLVKIRSLISPGSIVDGWGDIVPTGT